MPTNDFNLTDNQPDSQPHQYQIQTLSKNNRQHHKKREITANVIFTS